MVIRFVCSHLSIAASGVCSAAEVVNLSDHYQNADADSYYSVISDDGRFVAFQSSAANLVDGDDDDQQDIFVRDRQQQTTMLISTSLSGGSASGISMGVDMSSDGRFVVWESIAPDLVADDSNGTWDCFLWSRDRGDIVRLSATASGEQSDQRCGGWRSRAMAIPLAFMAGRNWLSETAMT